jgi:hypothetical protein
MAYTSKQSARDNQAAEESATKQATVNQVAPAFNDQRASTSVQLKQQQMMTAAQSAPLQRAEDEELLQGEFVTAQLMEDEELLQGKFVPAQLMEEEEPLQGKFATAQLAEDEELMQGKFATAQLVEEEEPLQGKFETAQMVEEEELLQGKFSNETTAQLEEKPNNTGLPNQLKSGIESLSGMSLDNVKVHYNSAKPTQLNAHAYAQGTDIHVAPGQERHLPHEAWHVVQQAQGRVKPTAQMNGTAVNDDVGLETEADVMGAKALQRVTTQLAGHLSVPVALQALSATGHVLQGHFDSEDIAKMRAVAKDDKALTSVLEELISIHDNYPEDINYGVSSKEGHAAINEQGTPQVVVKDERWQWSLKIKNLFNAYGMDHDIKRQSMIIHELTHIAEMMANHAPTPEGWGKEDKPKDEKELAKWMTPPKEVLEKIDWENLRKNLAATDYDSDFKKYLSQRLDYAYAFDWETPTVFTELNYYLKAKGKADNDFYNMISDYTNQFHLAREERKKTK